MKNFFYVIVIILSIAACVKKPVYPITPDIEYKSIQNNPMINQDSVVITLNFKDGDGDLGLNTSDTLKPYQLFITNPDGSKSPNKFFHNYFITAYKKDKGKFRPVNFPSPDFTYSGRFPLLKADQSNPSAIEGILRYSFIIRYAFLSDVNKNDTLQFGIQIADRQLHVSNEIFTEEMIIGRQK